MRRSDFYFELPHELIAHYPVEPRSASRLMCLEGGAVLDALFTDLPGKLKAGDLLVFNDTRVIPARLLGRKESSGKVEILIERIIDGQRALAQARASKPLRPGTRLILHKDAQQAAARVLARTDDFYEIEFEDSGNLYDILNQIGHVPLPPYIARADEARDKERYQTVYARRPGAVAAPTAGLHFDQLLLDTLAAKGVESAYVTLHVGAGTFQPVRVENLAEHKMHKEYLEVPARVCEQVRAARSRSGRVIAVGTTAVRALESASHHGEIKPFQGETGIFIYPGYEFKSVDALITNFHLPESTLLMLVCAFGGYERVMAAYRHAITRKYRFYSYGDAMFLTPAASSE
ncbi:MAG: tRNA preQ1(34) S-adenosylmethionine ribosyltransferase-isomerase QueA [Gammaproteobacteria bacterium]|nr:MAG: tRNA preQ1(34) S-adenosylmethionine ribosyltransferase-isomerase QueA [Gammaproteobacteria bacterium]